MRPFNQVRKQLKTRTSSADICLFEGQTQARNLEDKVVIADATTVECDALIYLFNKDSSKNSDAITKILRLAGEENAQLREDYVKQNGPLEPLHTLAGLLLPRTKQLIRATLPNEERQAVNRDAEIGKLLINIICQCHTSADQLTDVKTVAIAPVST
jgi:hypothetical protein